jgi:starch phosphorylase
VAGKGAMAVRHGRRQTRASQALRPFEEEWIKGTAKTKGMPIASSILANSLSPLREPSFRSSGFGPAVRQIHLNDTHPTMAVPELMRILLDEAHLGWDLTQRTLSFTNHTLLPEALEKWPVAWFEMLLPRLLEITYEIKRRLVDEVRVRYPGEDGRATRVSLIEEGPTWHVRMANLALVGSHSTNGVSAIRSRLLRTVTVKDLAEMFPERFSNKTNGVTPRRCLLLANPALARTITEAIGEDWITDLSLLS